MNVTWLPTIHHLPGPLQRSLQCMGDEQKLLLVLKREIYEGDWRLMITDLRNRLEGRPYVVRLAARIEDDLQRIEQLRALERRYRVDLTSFLAELDVADTESDP